MATPPGPPSAKRNSPEMSSAGKAPFPGMHTSTWAPYVWGPPEVRRRDKPGLDTSNRREKQADESNDKRGDLSDGRSEKHLSMQMHTYLHVCFHMHLQLTVCIYIAIH